jgi:hypothetical protein
VDWGLIVGMVGTILTLIFGTLSFYQKIERREQQRAMRTYSQAMYNMLLRMGAGAAELLRSEDLTSAKQIAAGINEVSQAAQNLVISLSKEYGNAPPYGEAAWEPKALPASKPFWRRFFL